MAEVLGYPVQSLLRASTPPKRRQDAIALVNEHRRYLFLSKEKCSGLSSAFKQGLRTWVDRRGCG